MFDAKMIPGYKKVHNKFKLNNIHYDYDSLQEVAYSFVKEGCSHEKEFGMFLLDWLDSNTYVNVKTSGSTGSPKIIKLNKQAMVLLDSRIRTCLLCVWFVAGSERVGCGLLQGRRRPAEELSCNVSHTLRV